MSFTPPFRILTGFMFPMHGTGSGRYARELATALSGMGHTVAMASPDERPVPGCSPFRLTVPIDAVLSSNPELPHAVSLVSLDDAQLSTIFGQLEIDLSSAISEFRPDLVHIHHASVLAWVAAECCSRTGTPLVITSHGTDLGPCAADSRFHAATLEALDRAGAVTTVSRHCQRAMIELFAGLEDFRHSVVIPGGVDTELFRPAASMRRAEQAVSGPTTAVIAYVGRLVPDKGVRYLIEAARGTEAHMLIAGDGPQRRELMDLAAQDRSVTFLGHLPTPAVAEIYRRADVVVVPSVWDEPFGLVCIEAMASGTPVVATRVGGIPEVVQHGLTGLLVPSADAAALARAVNSLLLDPSLRDRLSADARAYVCSRYSWHAIAAEFTAVYQAALADN